LPAFLPVYQPRARAFQLATAGPNFEIEELIVNSYFLCKQRDIRRTLTTAMGLHEFVGFNGVITTDGGAFHRFSRQLYLSNLDIVGFQDRIGSDVIATLDLVTPPWDKRTEAEAELAATNKRIREGLNRVKRGILAGVQQGGRFEDLRQRSTDASLEMGARYIAIGSLEPFLNRNHVEKNWSDLNGAA
jgi:7-cyano-7-deazaguanine tRNA-ribosyltransferase